MSAQLPKWVQLVRDHCCGCSCLHTDDLVKALTIAWEALGEADYQLQQQKYRAIQMTLDDAISDIEKLGGGE